MTLHTPLCDLLGIRYPIIQTGMGWVSGARLTAATSAAGGLGILGSATMTLPELEQAIAQVKERTDRPFGVNLRPDQEDLEARLALLVRERVALASFAGPPGKQVVATLKDAGVLTMPTVGARRHAEKMAELGVDLLIAQGGEGGGHTGEVPTSLLLPQVCDAVDIPVVGAGGFHDGRGLVAALAYGCCGIAMGTRFLMTRECAVPDGVKDLYLATQVNGTVVTRHIDGAPQRVIRTEVIDKLERAGRTRRFFRALGNALRFRRITGGSRWGVLREGLAMRRRAELPWAQLLMAANAPMMTRASMIDGRPDVGILPTGQVVGLLDELPTVEELLERIMAEATATLVRLQPVAAAPERNARHG
ncbi:MAG TPA: nitronate monooxygenase [Kofleriaceae bacterium]|jgi:NAD(P)H-dependent flavin oxidoreductase YrpB (nitropropane dioxygenase family)|nr:nitronate monooxygenase [Kofleriaceae bacterium]